MHVLLYQGFRPRQDIGEAHSQVPISAAPGTATKTSGPFADFPNKQEAILLDGAPSGFEGTQQRRWMNLFKSFPVVDPLETS